jgi:hypothetical protein
MEFSWLRQIVQWNRQLGQDVIQLSSDILYFFFEWIGLGLSGVSEAPF